MNRVRYISLGVLCVLALGFHLGNAFSFLDFLRHGEERIRTPINVATETMTVERTTPAASNAGIRVGDRIIDIDGESYVSANPRVMRAAHPGDVVRYRIERRENGAVEQKTIEVTLASQRQGPISGNEILNILTSVGMPLFCVLLGLIVTAVRPHDLRAWLLLSVMLSISVVLFNENQIPPFQGALRVLAVGYYYFFGDMWPISMLLFGIYFPSRPRYDVRWPGLKYVLLAPLFIDLVIDVGGSVSAAMGIGAAGSLLRAYGPYQDVMFIVGVSAVSTFFVNLGFRFGPGATPDERRRLRILAAGCFGSMTPAFIVLLLRLAGAPAPAIVQAVAFMLIPLFPLTLAYVIVVQRAMDLRVVIRQGVQYALATTGVRILQIAISAGVIVALINFGRSPARGAFAQAWILAIAVAAIAGVRRMAERLRGWTDRKFFREAYNAELILSDLAENVRTMIETGPLLETVARRISESLHVQRITIMLASHDAYQPAFAVGYGATPAAMFRADSGTIKQLRIARDPLRLYSDDRNSWIYKSPEIGDRERDALEIMQTQLLLPLAVKGKLTGFISLGPKQSEAPFTSSDVRLLQSVASQTTLALENSQLTAAIATEVAQRERINREMEIAREVQERLFPQEAPSIPGLEIAGGCRPALSVGGDYYDFLTLTGGKLGLAIGDVSGKGVGAALLMASLQACLRAQTVQGDRSLADLIRNINQVIHDTSPSNRYATFFYAQYDPQSRVMNYINAGHNPPIVMRDNDVLRLEVGGAVVGLVPGMTYEEGMVILQPGDTFIAFTDGVSEAMNSNQDEWGEEALIAAAQKIRNATPSEIMKGLMTAADSFAAGAPQHDDMTLVILSVNAAD